MNEINFEANDFLKLRERPGFASGTWTRISHVNEGGNLIFEVSFN